MNAIPMNTPVTLTASGQGGSWLGAVTSLGLSSGVADVQTSITSALRAYGLAPVSVNIRATNAIPVPVWPWNGTIIVRPTYDTDSDGISAAVADALQAATGYAASVAWNATGDASAADASNADNATYPDWLARVIDEVKKDATWIAVGGVGLVALAVIVIGYGPNIKKLASVNL